MRRVREVDLVRRYLLKVYHLHPTSTKWLCQWLFLDFFLLLCFGCSFLCHCSTTTRQQGRDFVVAGNPSKYYLSPTMYKCLLTSPSTFFIPCYYSYYCTVLLYLPVVDLLLDEYCMLPVAAVDLCGNARFHSCHCRRYQYRCFAVIAACSNSAGHFLKFFDGKWI